jgi:hypothetical protein
MDDGMFHSQHVNHGDSLTKLWWGVELSSSSPHLDVTVYVRNAHANELGGPLDIWVANAWPSDATDWDDNAMPLGAKKCATTPELNNDDVVSVLCTNTGTNNTKYLFVRPSKPTCDRGNAGLACSLQLPEVVVRASPRLGVWCHGCDWNANTLSYDCQGAAAAPGAAMTWWVGPSTPQVKSNNYTDDDLNKGDRSDAPLATIQHALNRAQDGDQVRLIVGTFTGGSDCNNKDDADGY